MNCVTSRCRSVPFALAVICITATVGRTSDDAQTPPRLAGTVASPLVAATVNGVPVYVGEVQRLVDVASKPKLGSPAQRVTFASRVLEQLIDRTIVQTYLDHTEWRVDSAQVDAKLAEARSALTGKKQSLDDLLRRDAIPLDAFRRQVAWDIAWQRYVEAKLGDDRLKAYFEDHRRLYDGTQLRVSHILFRSDETGAPRATAELVRAAAKLRVRIERGEISFAEAAARVSAGPSRHGGGDLGLIGRRGPMDAAFSQAAYELQPGEISHPVVTRFGVHLIRVTSVRAGKRAFLDVRSELIGPAQRDLFSQLAADLRKEAKVNYHRVEGVEAGQDSP